MKFINLIKSTPLSTLLFTFVLCLFLDGCEQNSKSVTEGSMTMLQNKPVFQLHIKSFGVSYGALVNGVYIHTQFDVEAADDFTFPVNHFFKSGGNKIALKVVPDEEGGEFNSKANIDMRLTVKEFGNQDVYTLLALNFSGANPPNLQNMGENVTHLSASAPFSVSETGDIEVSGLQVTPEKDYVGGLDIVQYIDIPSSLPRWKFFDSDKLPLITSLSEEESDAARAALFKEYEKIQDALVSKDIDSIIMLFNERSQELDQAFYEQSGTTLRQLKETLLETVNSSDMEISFVKEEWVGFGLSETNTLRELTREGEVAAIVYDYKDGGSRGFPIVYRRENGKWIITR